MSECKFEVGKCYPAGNRGAVVQVTSLTGMRTFAGTLQPVNAVVLKDDDTTFDEDASVCFSADGVYRSDANAKCDLVSTPVNPDGSPLNSTRVEVTEPVLDKAVLYLSQEGNCVDGGVEELRIRVEGSTGCDDSAFVTISTEGWSFEIDELPPSLKAAVLRTLGREA